MKSILKKILIGFLTFHALLVGAQIQTSVITPNEAIKRFVGSGGIEIENISFSGNANQLGAFSFSNHATAGFELEEGIILCNGSVKDLEPYAVNHQAQGEVYRSKLTHSGSDPDLELLSQELAGKSNQGKGVLEFKFKSIKGGQIEFEFIFGSHEYPLFAPSGSNGGQNKFDVFACLIKGPGIDADRNSNNTANFYPAGYKNLALVPGTNVPISVNTIYDQGSYSQYFVGIENTDNLTVGGITKSIKVFFNVQCGETYTMKFAIADVGEFDGIPDEAFDSYVFFKANSFVGQDDVGEIIISDGPYCQGSTYNLSISGSNNYQYLWSNGATGKQTTIVANSTDQPYSVKITDPTTGCSITKYGKIGHVYTNQNQAPYSKGMDHQNEYVRYVQAEKQICFDVGGFDYQADELVKILQVSKPTNAIVTGDIGVEKANPIINFCWTPGVENIGVNQFILQLRDNNGCNNLTTPVVLKIIVVCPFCPIDVYIENKNINDVPIASEVVAARSIVAGYSVDAGQPDGNVVIGSGETSRFRAGVEIKLKPGFIVEPGSDFKAITEPVCVDPDLCDTCCNTPKSFTGIFSNTFNLDDGFWEVVDFKNADCAYNITGFKLQIIDMRDYPATRVYVQEDIPSSGGERCCRYQSKRYFNDPYRVSSIHWNGVFNDQKSGLKPIAGDQFTCYLDIYNCDNTYERIPFVLYILEDGGNPMVLPQTDLKDNQSYIDTITGLQKFYNILDSGFTEKKLVNLNSPFGPHFLLFPNPNTGIVNLSTSNWPENVEFGNITVYDSYGRALKKFDFYEKNIKFDISDLSNGTYVAKIEIGNYSEMKKIILQK